MPQEDAALVAFPDGLVGFPHLTRFRLLEPADGYPLKFLQSIEAPEVSFTAMDVAAFKPDYVVPLDEPTSALLALDRPEEALVMALLAIPEDPRETTADLAGPIVVNVRTGTGAQVVLDSDMYPLKHLVFGEQEFALLHLPEGLVGFPELRRFRLFEPQGSYPLKFLQSMDQEDRSFVCADAAALQMDYRVPLSPADADALALERPEDALVLVMVVVPEDPRQMTANLAGPLVINTATRKGLQVVLSTETYPLRHRILGDRT